MWSNVQLSDGCPAPSSRSKHAMCASQEGSIYLLGGRSANLPLKDLWKFNPVQSVWEELKCRGNRPPCLQEHTMVYWKNNIYVFGGEIGFASTGETPLWILDLTSLTWKKLHVRGGTVHQPSGRRGHSAVMYDGFMHVFGGYQDLRGSSSELWIFDLGTERWSHLLTPSYFEQPPPRHNHSCIVHDGAMWIYGGLTDLQPRADFWKWDFGGHRWSRVKSQRGPGELHSHGAVKGMDFMYIFGGERSGNALNELWRFHFATEIWERMNAEGIIPPPRCRHVVISNPDFQDSETKLHAWGVPPEEKVAPALPPKSISMCFGQTEHKRYFKFKVHPVSRFCSKNTASDEDDNDEYASYNSTTAQVNLKTLRDKFQSSRLVRSISSGSYSILHNQSVNGTRKDELEKLVEESPHRPRLKIQKSQSSDAVLESSDGESTPQHKSTPLWVENPNTLLRHKCTSPTARVTRGPLSTVRDVIEENSENADEPNMIDSIQNNENKNPNEGLLVDLREYIKPLVPDTQNTPSIENRGLPHSLSHSSGYHSLNEEDTTDCHHREFAGCLNTTPSARKHLLKGRDLELKTFTPANGEALLPPPPCKQRARSLDRTSQRKLVRSYPSGGSITPTVLMSTSIVEDSFMKTVSKMEVLSAATKRMEEESSHHWSPSRLKPHQHEWNLCLYMFGGREQSAPGVYRQPISIWKLYV